MVSCTAARTACVGTIREEQPVQFTGRGTHVDRAEESFAGGARGDAGWQSPSCLLAGPVWAIDTTWSALDASNADDWQAAANWTSGTPGSSDVAHFTSSAVTTVKISVPVADGGIGAANGWAKGITFSGESDFTITSVANAGGTLYVYSEGIVVEGGNQTFDLGTRPSSSGVFPVVNNGSGLLTFNSSFMVNVNQLSTTTIDGDGDVQMASLSRRYANTTTQLDLVKNGNGTLTIVGAHTSPGSYDTINNKYSGVGYSTGTMTINAGTVRISDEANLGGDPGGYVDTTNTWVPGSFDADALLFGGGTLQATASFTIDDGNRGVTLGDGGGTFEVVAGETLTVANPIAGTGSLTKTGEGTLVLTADNTYAGATNVNEGILNIQNANALGDTATGTTVANYATLQVQGGLTVDEPIFLTGGGYPPDKSWYGALRSTGGDNTWSGTITLNGSSRIGCGTTDTFTLTGGITGTGNVSFVGTIVGASGSTIQGDCTGTHCPSSTSVK